MTPDERTAAVAAAARKVLLPDVLIVEDLAAVLRVGPSAVRAHLRAGRLPGRRIGRRWLVSRVEFLRVLAPDAVGFRLVPPESKS